MFGGTLACAGAGGGGPAPVQSGQLSVIGASATPTAFQSLGPQQHQFLLGPVCLGPDQLIDQQQESPIVGLSGLFPPPALPFGPGCFEQQLLADGTNEFFPSPHFGTPLEPAPVCHFLQNQANDFLLLMNAPGQPHHPSGLLPAPQHLQLFHQPSSLLEMSSMGCSEDTHVQSQAQSFMTAMGQPKAAKLAGGDNQSMAGDGTNSLAPVPIPSVSHFPPQSCQPISAPMNNSSSRLGTRRQQPTAASGGKARRGRQQRIPRTTMPRAVGSQATMTAANTSANNGQSAAITPICSKGIPPNGNGTDEAGMPEESAGPGSGVPVPLLSFRNNNGGSQAVDIISPAAGTLTAAKRCTKCQEVIQDPVMLVVGLPAGRKRAKRMEPLTERREEEMGAETSEGTKSTVSRTKAEDEEMTGAESWRKQEVEIETEAQRPPEQQFFHCPCLKCEECGEELEHAGKCFERAGQVFCARCYSRQWGVCCAMCERPINTTDWVRRARQFVYHLACFKCEHCKRQLNTGEQFSLDDSQQRLCADWAQPIPRLLCKQHYLELIRGEQCSPKPKAKRVRTTFHDDQLAILNEHFKVDSNPDGADLERIAQLTGLSKRVTQVWFQNSRARQKKHSGGGRGKCGGGQQRESEGGADEDMGGRSATITPNSPLAFLPAPDGTSSSGSESDHTGGTGQQHPKQTNKLIVLP